MQPKFFEKYPVLFILHSFVPICLLSYRPYISRHLQICPFCIQVILYLAYILLNLSKSIHFQKVHFFNFIHLPFSNICQPLSPDSQRCVNYLTFSFKDIFIFHPKMERYYLVLPNPLRYGHWATIILLLFNYSYVGYSMVMQHSWTWNDLPKFFFSAK